MPRSKTRGSRTKEIVANMGLFWHRDKVLWRGDRRHGRSALLGRRKNAKTKGVVDFWDQTGVYALYADYKLVYVGQAGLSDKSNIGKRLRTHTGNDLAGRWNMFSWFGLRKVGQGNKLGARFKLANTTQPILANVLEGVVIEIAEPPMNSQRGRFGPRVVRFLQVPREDETETVEDRVKAIGKEVGKIGQSQQKLSAMRAQLARIARKLRAT